MPFFIGPYSKFNLFGNKIGCGEVNNYLCISKYLFEVGAMKYKGYTGSVEYSPEDECLFGQVQGLHGTLISYEGDSVDEIRKDFEGAVDDYLASRSERGIEGASAQ